MTKAVNVLVGILIIYILNQSQWILVKDDKTISSDFPVPLVLGPAQRLRFPFPTDVCVRCAAYCLEITPPFSIF